MKRLILICLLAVCFCARADHLVVSRGCIMKGSPERNGAAVQRLSGGDTLVLLSEDQQNGYYHVRLYGTEASGWVYRTFVRRYAGNLPEGNGEQHGHAGATVGDGKLEVRVVDVGAGLCNLVKLPDGKYIVYDAGHFREKGESTMRQIGEFIPPGSDIELMVLSHTDGDHIGAAAGIIEHYHVKQLFWGGYEKSSFAGGKPSASYERLLNALGKHPEVRNVNLYDRDSMVTPGTHVSYGAATLTYLCGFGSPLPEWKLTDKAEKINSVSIVMKLEYAGNSILFCGDAVGRHKDDKNPNALLATEEFLVKNAASLLKSTIVIAPHHGASNGSSRAFVQSAQPEAVIFSAGHQYHHPTDRTANEYLAANPNAGMFRTDRGDDEGEGEWDFLRIAGCADQYDDDNIQIVLRKNGTYSVFYLDPENTCDE